MNAFVHNDAMLINLLAGASREGFLLELGGPREGAYIDGHGGRFTVGVWNGAKYETAEFLDIRDALEIALSEDLGSIREKNQ